MMKSDCHGRCSCGVSWPKPEKPCQPCMPVPCHCYDPCPSKSTATPRSYLLPRVIATGRQWQRCHQACLDVHGLPCPSDGPLTLCCIDACGSCQWEYIPVDSGQFLCLRVTIPLQCRLRDRCGCLLTGHASLSTEVTLRLSCTAAEYWRHQMMLLPCVRLTCPPCASDTGRFDVQMELLLEAYLIRLEPCFTGVTPPVCPQLPLYPQPCFH